MKRAPTPKKAVLFLQGTIGSGKSTVGQRAVDMLAAAGVRAVALEQDTFVPKHGLKKAGAACFAEFQRLLGTHDVIVLQRNNANVEQFGKYADEAKYNGFTRVFWTPSEWYGNDDGDDDGKRHDEAASSSSSLPAPRTLLSCLLALTCMQSVMLRKGHVGLKHCPLDRQLFLVLSFLCQLHTPTAKHADTVLRLEYFDRKATEECKLEPDVAAYYVQYLAEVRRDGFKAKPKPQAEVILRLQLDTSKYQSLRRPIVEHLKNILTAPEVSVSLGQTAGQQQIAGEHLVGPDGTRQPGHVRHRCTWPA